MAGGNAPWAEVQWFGPDGVTFTMYGGGLKGAPWGRKQRRVVVLGPSHLTGFVFGKKSKKKELPVVATTCAAELPNSVRNQVWYNGQETGLVLPRTTYYAGPSRRKCRVGRRTGAGGHGWKPRSTAQPMDGRSASTEIAVMDVMSGTRHASVRLSPSFGTGHMKSAA